MKIRHLLASHEWVEWTRFEETTCIFLMEGCSWWILAIWAVSYEITRLNLDSQKYWCFLTQKKIKFDNILRIDRVINSEDIVVCFCLKTSLFHSRKRFYDKKWVSKAVIGSHFLVGLSFEGPSWGTSPKLINSVKI